jgi:hypothetical protein
VAAGPVAAWLAARSNSAMPRRRRRRFMAVVPLM